MRDVRHALRLLGAHRGYAAVLVLTLAVGIGACTAIFSLFTSLLLTPLPFAEPDRLVLLWETPAGDRGRQFTVSAPNYQDWATETRSFAALALWESLSFNVSASAEPARVPGIRTSASLFDVLRVQPALGRRFTLEDQQAGRPVAIVSDAIWKVHFGSDHGVIGRPIRLNGAVHEVIGVLPPQGEFPDRGVGIWVPLALRPEENRGWHAFLVAARLADGVTFDQARDEVERLGAVLRERHQENANEGATAVLMSEFGLSNVRGVLVVLSGAVALVLLIACVNAASLQLAFGLSRRREFATRLSLGARYAHVVRQVLVEGLVLAWLGCVAGVGIAALITRSIDRVMTPGFRAMPFRGEVDVGLDWTVLAFAAGISVLCALLFGFAPLSGLRQASLQATLRAGDRGATRAATTIRRVLVTIEIALAIVVLCAAGLMIRSLSTLLDVNPGLDAANVLTMTVSLPQDDPHGVSERPAFCTNLEREAGTVPGVTNVSAVNHLPLSGANSDRILSVEGRADPAPGAQPYYAEYRIICGGYFTALGIPLLSGRDFDARDTSDATPVAIVNRAFADEYFQGGDATSKRVKLGRLDSVQPWLTIVGVVENVRHFGLEAAPTQEIYRPYGQAASPLMTVIARTVTDPLAFQRPLRDALTRVEPELPAGTARTMEEVIGRSVAWRATPMRMLTGFAIVGLLLAALGIYAVLAYYVSLRTRELGVRLALGASKATLIALVLRQSALPLGAGIVLGIAGALASGKLLAGLLYEISAADPLVLSTMVAIVILVSLVSSWLPARRAASIDPISALRDE